MIRILKNLALKCNVPFNGISFYKSIKIVKNNYSYSNEEIKFLISEIKLIYLITKIRFDT